MAGGRRNPVEWLEYLRRATNWKVCPDPGGLGRGSRLKRNQFDDGPNTKAGIDSKVCRRTWERSEEHTSELQSRLHLVCRLLLEKKKKIAVTPTSFIGRGQRRSSILFTLCLSAKQLSTMTHAIRALHSSMSRATMSDAATVYSST